MGKLAKALFVLIIIAFVIFTITYGQAAWQMQLRNNAAKLNVCNGKECPVNYTKPIVKEVRKK